MPSVFPGRVRQSTFAVSQGLNSAARWGAVLALGALCVSAQAQTVAPQFQTAARSLITEKVDRTRTSPTQGAVSAGLATATDLGEVSASLPMEHIQLVLNRTTERQAAFDAQAEALHTKGSPSYHQWLTPQVVGSAFGPSASDLETLTSYLQSEGFTVNNVGAGGLYVDFTGTAAQVEHSFQTEIHNVRMPNGDLRIAAIREASIPAALAPLVVGVVSLSSIPSAHPNYHRAVDPAILPANVKANAAGGAKPMDTVSTTNYAVGPQDFYTIYNENPLLTATNPINGKGVTVALLEEAAIQTADVTSFRTTFGVSPATPASLVVDTGYGKNTCTAPVLATGANSGEEGEAVLDTEWSSSVAPGANIIFMQCASTNATGGIFLSAEAVIDNNLADTMSLSYGIFEGYDTTEDNLVNQLWEQAASQGETVIVSAGDDGSMTEDGNYGDTTAKYGITVNGLASTNWNVSAGGTDFMDAFNGLENSSSPYQISNYWNSTNGAGESSALSYVPEMTWNDNCASSVYSYYFYSGAVTDAAEFCGANNRNVNKNVVGGGGGPSKLTTRPRASWQTGTVVGIPSTTTYANRLQPDVSFFASNGFWYHSLPVYESDAGGIGYAGGTSFVAPQLAGMFALVQQKTGERQGQPNYVLYSMAGTELGTTKATNACNGSGSSGAAPTSTAPADTGCIFHDVQVGNNSGPCKTGTTDCFVGSGKTYGIVATSATTDTPAFSTDAGYDMATGIGSININNLVSNWQSATLSTIFTPTVAVTSTAKTYTYGSPVAFTYVATVSGSGSYPTGTVTFSGSTPIGAIGSGVALVGSSGCSTASTCSESATTTYTPSATLPAGSYTITATYSTTNENYATGSGNVGLGVSKQTPALSVTPISAPDGSSPALTASVTFTGSGNAPTGAVTFQVDSGSVLTATCTDSTSLRNCEVNYPLVSLSVGQHTITAKEAADTNYVAISNTGTLTITAPTQTVFVVNPGGTVTTYTDGGVLQSDPTAGGGTSIAVDASGYVWSIDTTGSSVSKFTDVGALSADYSGGGLSGATAVAIDGLDRVYLVNSTGTITVLSSAGTPISATPIAAAGGINGPASISVNEAGSLWISNSGNNTVTEVIGAAAPVLTPTVTAVTNQDLGTRP